MSYVDVPHGVELNGEMLFYSHIHVHGGPHLYAAICPS